MVTALPPRPLSSALLRRARARRRERGAAMFIVVMVIVMLTGVGIFATRAASLVDTASGHSRQALQGQYVAELGLQSTSAFLANGLASDFVAEASTGTFTCPRANASATPGPFCYPFFFQDVEDTTTNPLLAQGAGLGADGDASLGPYVGANSRVYGDFVVEMTDLGPAPPCRGCEVSDVNTGITQARVALTSTATVRPDLDGVDPTTCSQLSASAASQQSLRGYTVVAPIFR